MFPIQGSNPGLQHCRRIHLSHQGNPKILEWVAYPFSRGTAWPKSLIRVSCIAGGFFTSWATREVCLTPTSYHPRCKWKNWKYKILEKNKWTNPHDSGFRNGFLNMTPKAQATVEKTGTLGLHWMCNAMQHRAMSEQNTHLQITHLVRFLNPEYIKNSHNSKHEGQTI